MALFVALSAFVLYSCEKDDNGGDEVTQPDDRVDIVITKSQQDALDISNEFAFKVFKEISKTEIGDMLFSPLSLQVALYMLANGASGNTYTEMTVVMGVKDMNIAEINGLYKTLLNGLSTADKTTKLTFANSFWVGESVMANILNQYRLALSENFSADVYENTAFGSIEATSKINSWVESKTDGMIKDLFKQTTADMQFILIDALYFNGQWSNKFDKTATASDEFLKLDGTKTEIDMMFQQHTFVYNKYNSFATCKIPYGNEAFSMTVILPDEGCDFKKFIDGIDYELLFSNFSYPELYTNVKLYLPKFSIEYETQKLGDQLNSLGMKMFGSGEKSLGNMMTPETSGIPLQVVQKAKLDLDESGTTAAAATAITSYLGSAGTGSEPGPFTVEFKANRPFVYVIQERSTGAILFIGEYTGI